MHDDMHDGCVKRLVIDAVWLHSPVSRLR